MEKIILRLEAIQERAESGVSEKCAVDGCKNEKKTSEARTCSDCYRKYPGIAQRVDQAVEEYKKTAFIYESKRNSRVISNRIQQVEKLGPKAWRALQEEIKAAVGDQNFPDNVIVQSLQRMHPDFSEELRKKVVGNFRKWQRFLSKVKDLFEIDLWLDNEGSRGMLVNQIRYTLEKTEFSNYGRETVAQVCYEIFPSVKREIIFQAEKLAEEITVADQGTSAYNKAREISDAHGRIEGYAFRKLLKAVAERMTKIKIEKRREEVVKKELSDLRTKNERRQSEMAKSQEIRKSFASAEEIKIRKAEKKKELQRRKLAEILARPKETIALELSDFRPAILVKSEEEASLLNNGTYVVMNKQGFRVSKSPGGKFCLKTVKYLLATETKKFDEVFGQVTEDKKPASLNEVWVMCPDIASEAIKVFCLTREQISDSDIILNLQPNSLVVEDAIGINNVPLSKVSEAKLIQIGPCRKATRQERNASSEYKSREKKQSSNAQ
ncbi:MAG: hypothetical protein ABH830_00875 [Patescibacteria group bacterium]